MHKLYFGFNTFLTWSLASDHFQHGPSILLLVTRLRVKLGIGTEPSTRGATAVKGGFHRSRLNDGVFWRVTRFLWWRLALVNSRTYFSGVLYSGLPSLTGSVHVPARSGHKYLFSCGSDPFLSIVAKSACSGGLHTDLANTLWLCLFTLFVFFEAVADDSGRTGTNTASTQPYVPLETGVYNASSSRNLLTHATYAMMLFSNDVSTL